MQKRHIHIAAIFLGVIIVLGLFMLLLLVGAAVFLYYDAPKPEALPDNIFVLIGFAVVIISSLAFFLAAFVASYFSYAKIYLERMVHALGTWAILTLLLSFTSITALGILELKERVGSINHPYVSTDMEVLNLRAITKLNLTGHKEDRSEVIEQISHTQQVIAWASCVSVIIGLGASCAAAAFSGRGRTRLLDA